MLRHSLLIAFAGAAAAKSIFEAVTLEELNQLMESPNAVAESSFSGPSGFDISQEWPGSTEEGWRARIEIKTDIPAPGSGYFTMTRLSLVPPEGVKVMTNATSKFVKTDKTWYPCANFYQLPNLNVSTPDKVDSCPRTLPDACIDDLKERYNGKNYGPWEYELPFPQCFYTVVPDSCRPAFGEIPEKGALISTEPSRDNPLEYMNLNLLYNFDGYHVKGDHKIYEAALGTFWIMSKTLEYSKYSEFANKSGIPMEASITCLQASEKKSPASGNNGDKDTDNRDNRNGSSGKDGQNADADDDSSAVSIRRYSATSIALLACMSAMIQVL